VAENCFSKNSRINFIVADVTAYQITPKMGYILSDVLHYLKPDQQDDLLRRCCQDLLPGGIILVREANSELANKHVKSRHTEFLSTRIGFNKTSNPNHDLWFTSSGRIEAVAREEGLLVETIGTKRLTSNTLFALRKPPAVS
jgi:O-methyltransferase involved in polyketide biosynthesis